MKTEICITVDVEFSIAGAFEMPERYLPLGEEVVNCIIEGHDQGLGFLLRSLARAGIPATFFTEALQTLHFGDEPMGHIARRIADAGHDVQLHLHPCWLHFRDSAWREPGFRPDDSCAGRTDAELDELIGLGLATFARWGLAPPRALRAGGFRADGALYRAMARTGLRLASNIGLGVFQPAEAELRVACGRRMVHDVLEVPSFSYLSTAPARPWSRNWRTLAITATSSPEMDWLLWAARRSGLQSVVILTHPFEFVKKSSFRYSDLRVNHVNQARFSFLLDFLARNRDDFEAITFAQRGPAWLEAGPAEGTPLSVPARYALMRTAQNLLNDLTDMY